MLILIADEESINYYNVDYNEPPSQKEQAIIESFMGSPSHKKILMKENIVYVGDGRYDSKFDGDNDNKDESMSVIFIEMYGEDENLDYIPD